MSDASRALDLVVLVADADQRETLKVLLSERPPSLGMRRIEHTILKHPQRDPGCFHGGPELLQTYQRSARHALAVLDHEGSGQEDGPADAVALDLKGRLSRSGWGDRAEVLVIAPELEAWVWSESSHVDEVLGWAGRSPGLRAWLREKGLWPEGLPKPPRPEMSFREALRATRVKRSASLYGELAARVSLEKCRDPSFERLKRILVSWFPQGPGT